MGKVSTPPVVACSKSLVGVSKERGGRGEGRKKGRREGRDDRRRRMAEAPVSRMREEGREARKVWWERVGGPKRGGGGWEKMGSVDRVGSVLTIFPQRGRGE